MNLSRLTFSGLIAVFCTSMLFPNDSHAGVSESSADCGRPPVVSPPAVSSAEWSNPPVVSLPNPPAVSLPNPNIVIVLTDDLGYGDVSFLNPESKVQTPHMDALARAGVWATDAHAPSTVCSPSRYAMLTGRYAWRGKLRAGRLNPWEASAIDSDRITLPKILKT